MAETLSIQIAKLQLFAALGKWPKLMDAVLPRRRREVF